MSANKLPPTSSPNQGEAITDGSLSQPPPAPPSESATFNQVRDIHAADGARVHVGNNVVNNYSTTNETEQDIINKCIANLQQPTNPRQDKSRIERNKGGLLFDSYKWVLETPEFLKWRGDDNDESRLLWVKGDPGKGKTMLLCGIINELAPSTKLANPNNQTLMSYFFCEATNSKINNPTAVLRGLVYLLVEQLPSLTSHVLKKQHGKSEQDPEHWNSFECISEVFSSILDDPALKNAYFIVDALDECTKDLKFLLDFIISKCSSSEARWIVSSRNHRNIEELVSSIRQKIPLSLELNDEAISKAVDSFIQRKVTDLTTTKGCDNETKSFIQGYLSHHSGSTFLWVALVCLELEKAPWWNLKDHLQSFPAGLNPLYERMLCQIRQSTTSDFCEHLLGIIITVYRPITIEELVPLDDRLKAPEAIPGIIAECGSFLIIKDGTIYFLHQSAKDFLVTKIKERHLYIFQHSFKSMAILEKDIYKLIHPAITLEQALSRRPNPDPLACARYSCLYWAEHLQEAEKSAREQGNPSVVKHAMEEIRLRNFIEENILFWIEALSLLGALSNGLSSLRKLGELFASHYSSDSKSEIIGLVRDAYRFIQYFRHCIEEYPLQIYASGLAFSPRESLIRTRFRHCAPEWLETNLEMDEDEKMEIPQNECLQVIETPIFLDLRLSFSPISKQQLAAWGQITMEGLRVWSVTDGEHQPADQSINTKGRVTTLSPDWKWMATAAWNYDLACSIVQVWDYDADIVKFTRSGSKEVMDMAFSPDGEWLAMYYDPGIIQLWQLRTDAIHTLIMRESFRITCFIFSSDSQLVGISDCRSEDFFVFDLNTCKKYAPAWENDSVGRNISATFLPNSHKLALTIGGCSELVFYDLKMETIEKSPLVLGIMSDNFNPLVFSPDGELLAITTHNAVHLYDATTLTFRRKLPIFSSSITALAISSDTRRLAAGCGDGTVWLWDPTQVLAQAPNSPSCVAEASSITQMFVLPPNFMLVSYSGDWTQTIHVWDTNSGHRLSTFNTGYFSPLSAFACSFDSSICVSASPFRSWAIYDSIKGVPIYTLSHDLLQGSSWPLAISPGKYDLDGGASRRSMRRLWHLMKDRLSGKDISSSDSQPKLVSSYRLVISERTSSKETSSHTWIATTKDRRVFLWEMPRQKLWKMFDVSEIFDRGANNLSLAFCPKRRLLAIAGLGKEKSWTLLLGNILSNAWCRTHCTSVGRRHGYDLRSLVGHLSFSPCGQSVISALVHSIIVWDLESETSKVYSYPDIGKTMVLNDSAILTSRGILDLDSSPIFTTTVGETEHYEATAQFLGCGISPHTPWITWDGHDLLWLPIEYRPANSSCRQILVNKIFIGCNSGRVLQMRFFPALLQPIMEQS